MLSLPQHPSIGIGPEREKYIFNEYIWWDTFQEDFSFFLSLFLSLAA